MYQDTKSYDGKVNLLDVSSKEFLNNPYKFYRERREASRVVQVNEMGYSITGYNEGYEFLRNRSTGREDFETTSNTNFKEYVEQNPVVKIIHNWMLFKNPPAHTRLRHLVAKAFTPRRISDLESKMREIVNERIDSFDNSPVDFISEFAYSFPVSIISHMMGIPEEDRDLFRKWSQDFAIALGADVSTLPDMVRNRLNQSATTLINYFEKLLDGKRDNIEDGMILDLLDTLLIASEDGDKLSTEELLSNATLLLVAGHETTTNLLGNGIHALTQYPDQLEILNTTPEIIPNAVEEFLRYDSPVQSVGRKAFDDIQLGDVTIEKGKFANVFIGGANRDPAVNPNPEVLDITRDDPKHLSFGQGIHYCLGAPLARLEAKVAFEELFDRFDKVELVEDPTRSPIWLLRGFTKLPVKFS